MAVTPIHRPATPAMARLSRRLWRGPGHVGSRWRRLGAGLAAVAGAALVLASAAVHLHLWAYGYRHIPTTGALFLAQGVAGIPLALAIAGWRRLLLIAAGAGYMAASIVGFVLAAGPGLFGFHDSLSAPFAGVAVSVEAAGLVLLVAAGAMILSGRPRP